MSVARPMVSLAVLALAFGGCHGLGLDQPEGIAVRRDDQGNLIALYRACHKDATVTRLRLLDARGTRGDSSDDQTLWEIRATSASSVKQFIVGQTPDGFREDVALTSLPNDGRLLRVAVETSELPHGESSSFSTTQLRTDRLRVGDGYQAEEEFVVENS